MQKPTCAVIIKTHNSQLYLTKAMDSLELQTVRPDSIVIMDSASNDITYLNPYQKQKNIQVIIEKEDVGFCRGNNIAYNALKDEYDYVLFLNPDAFLTPQFIECAIQYMQNPAHKKVAALTGALLGYNIKNQTPTGLYDSTGIFQNWYGRWYDRDQGQSIASKPQYRKPESIPAICGALFFCRNLTLKEILIRDNEVFDSSFFMYKEDIDLSLRIRKKGWDLVFEPSLEAYHCRGWNQDRSQVPRQLRLYSARNEIKLHAKQKSPYLFYSLLKYFAVKLGNV